MSAKKTFAKSTTKASGKKAAPARGETEIKATPATKPVKEKKAKTNKPKTLSDLDAAARVLRESGESMATKAMIEAMSTKGHWTSPGGQTPHAALYAAIIRKINVKGSTLRRAGVLSSWTPLAQCPHFLHGRRRQYADKPPVSACGKGWLDRVCVFGHIKNVRQKLSLTQKKPWFATDS